MSCGSRNKGRARRAAGAAAAARCRPARETDGFCGALSRMLRGEGEQRNNELALNGIFLETNRYGCIDG